MVSTATVTAPRVTAAEAAALMLADQVPSWHRGRSKVDGQPLYLAPSRTIADVAHRCTNFGCTCKGFERYGRCAHSAAVRIHEQRQQPAAPKRKSYSDLFPPCAAGCGELVERTGERCYACLSAETRRLDQARRAPR
jgi:hypothetical protein